MMKWNVYIEDVNRKEIKVFDVFSYTSFRDEVKLALEVCSNRAEFARSVERSALYHFWSKSEYEVVITSWPPYISRFEANQIKQADLPKYRTAINLETGSKISVYDQLMLNQDAFIDYCWSFRTKGTQKVKVRRIC